MQWVIIYCVERCKNVKPNWALSMKHEVIREDVEMALNGGEFVSGEDISESDESDVATEADVAHESSKDSEDFEEELKSESDGELPLPPIRISVPY